MGLGRIFIKDGGFATQLTSHVGNQIDGDPLWSAKFNATNPQAIIDTHLDFLQAGADIILTNTYQASVEGYVEYLNMDEEQSVELIKRTVQFAKVAKEKYLSECDDSNQRIQEGLPMILASIGPYGAHLHDGSEYTGTYADYVAPSIIAQWHRTRIDACLEVGVDALAIETIPCQAEADVLVDLLCDEYPEVKFWISFQCKDGTSLAHGECFREAALSIWEKLAKRKALHNCLAIGVNCLHPKFVTQLFQSLNGNRSDKEKIPLVVYPNSGEVYDVRKGWTGKEDCVPLENYVPEWIHYGAKIIGGCCRTYARDIKRMAECARSLEGNKI